MSSLEVSSVDPIARCAENSEWISADAEAAAQQAVRSVFTSAGAAGEAAKSFLHGDWMHQPLHAVLTDVPIGAWTVTCLCDLAGAVTGNRRLQHAADASLNLGLAGAAAAAVAGATDWSEIKDEKARRIGSVHAVLNIGATGFFLASSLMRRQKRSRTAAALVAAAGYAVASLSAHLGGNLVYEHGIGVRQQDPVLSKGANKEMSNDSKISEETRRDPEDRPVSPTDEEAIREKNLDKTLADSFPTSDPPSSIPNPS